MSQTAQITLDAAGPLLAVAHRESIDTLARRFARLKTWFAADLAQLDACLGAVGPQTQDVAWKAGRHLLDRPGKRVRPLCVLLAARLGDRPFDGPVQSVAVACELVHAATLLHDDVIDEGDMRRGVPAARRIYGNSASVLAGNHLFIDALRRVDAPPLRSALLDVIAEMITGEALQLERRGRFEPDRAAYLSVVRGKTGALFRYALWAGGALGGLPAHQTAALAQLGESLGIAFQVIDDLLDLRGDPAVTGKSACTDLREGKLTWPLILAAERDPTIARRLEALASSPEIDLTEAAATIKAVQALGVLEETQEMAQAQANQARAALAELPQGRVNDALATVIDAVLQRSA